MDLNTRTQTNTLSWTREAPLPHREDLHPRFQSWYQFDPAQKWIPTQTDADSSDHAEPTLGGDASNLVLLTWNIDAGSSQAQERATDIITYLTRLDPPVDIVFLQEVSRPALQQILEDERIRGSWLSSDCDDLSWNDRPFMTVTLLSRARFATPSNPETHNLVAGPIWRVRFPSYFGRDALCCDIFVPSPPEDEASSATRIRLVNVHLDSLPIKPSHRPRQISMVASLLRTAGRGLVAGDFNPVLDEDDELLEFNGLTDVWASLRSKEPGYTWGVDGQQPYPPNRLDRVGTLGLKASTIQVLEPRRFGDWDTPSFQQTKPAEEAPFWSDHHGLLCSFGLAED
ncbi:hypothetical protein ASPACDRAFT_43828 [Aspergillus aculeatus ATCC 16872]|uniref:Endonuclease/exonuclease/phosphatase domain-containing protein n=1 Tax=Aspergillus aculeatus (strain ATCC 16872 / CBS 172.66 / WB 5094) TaxID=690307 RepID=A0A1L9WSH7_ASPA1|nr:uncharacterized protein ASPACDRAFT_43828 [Aspergillus aculeatus ATCC 16872]OJJ99166.1 hypothetical protein ASPACDRAFT_43828 [Aspergillus aculeatus ATCC 16872]